MEEKEHVPRKRGSVKNKGGGRFKVTVYVGLGPDGKRLYHRKTLRDSTDAKAWKYARDVAGRAERGEYFAPERATVRAHLAEWLERQRKNGVRQTTREYLERHVQLHLVPHLAPEEGPDIPLTKVSTDALQTLFDRLLDEGYKPSSVRLIAATARRALRFAVKRGRLKSNPADAVELPPRNRPKKARAFDEREAASFVEAAWRDRAYVIFVLALASGMRPGELSGVEYPDLALEVTEADGRTIERGVVRVRRAVVWSRGKWYFNEPKTEAGRRAIYFPAVVYHELMARKAEHMEGLRRLGREHQLVFTNDAGEPLGRRSLTRRFFAACRRAGISTEGRSLYTLRRSHATLSLLAGENLKTLSERMGHRSVNFTLDEYADVLPAMQRTAADRLESVLLRTRLAPFEGAREM